MSASLSESQILALAHDLLRRHGVQVPVRWSRARRYLAAVAFERRSGRAVQLRLSKPLLPRLAEEVVRDAILHEIAHVHAGVEAGHGPAWKRAAARVGARPNRTTHVPDEVHERVGKYRATCGRCGCAVYWHRRPKYPVHTYRHDPRKCGGRLQTLEALR